MIVPRAVLMMSGLVSVNTTRQVNISHLKTTVNAGRPMSYLSKTAHSTVKRPIHKNTTFKKSNFNQRVNIVQGNNGNIVRPKEVVNAARPKAVVNVVQGNNVNAVKASACYGNPKMDLQDQGVIDGGCSRHLIGNMFYLTDYEEIDGGYVTFGENPKGGKITGRCTIKTVKGNLVRGLPSKLFENDHTVLPCQKGSNTELFYKRRLVGILKSFIIGIENLVDHKVKVIRCNNEAEFKNREMNQFGEMKGILRQFSIARTSQQNGVAERRNMTLIEAARTMLADTKLPTTFWGEAINTTCCVQNRVLVVKPHNKTPYELFHSRTPTLSFMRPFVSHVTILNTIDHLSKFDGKADEDFFVGYSLNSKAFRVFNSRTRIVEENLLIRFSGSTPNVVGSGPDWLFDIDALTRTMNYEPIVAGTQSNGFAGTKASDNAGYMLLVEKKHGNFHLIQYAAWKDFNIFDSRRYEDNGAVADINNLDTTIQVSPNPTTRIHKGRTQKGNLCIEGSKLDRSYAGRASTIQDKRGIVIRNKARLVAQGYTQEEGINYDEVFPPVARTKAIRLFLAYASFKDFVIEYTMLKKHCIDYIKLLKLVYVDDIIFGSTKKELCIAFEKLMHEKFQMSSMGELTFFLGLQVKQKKDGIFISQDKYVAKILKKFGFTEVKTASTPMETQKPLLKDEDGKEVDVHMYRSMIGSLMYLTSSRPDIMFVVCACARYQVNPKVSHLYVVKRIFRYLKGQPKLGLWYPKDSPFDLVAYTDSDYAGASLDMKSTTGGCQILGCRLISWQCKKQIVVANSTIKAKYVAASS
ncbi:retrovirus-related pol polyprotein from transposon TNT 1-94 [Tanacetum coccineum]